MLTAPKTETTSTPSNHPEGLHPPTCSDSILWELWLSRLHLPALVAADEMGVFPYLAHHPSSSDEVAQALEITPRGAEALLGVLAGLELVRKQAGRFHLTITAQQYLLPASPYYWGDVFRAYRSAPDRHSPDRMVANLRAEPATQQSRVSDDWAMGNVPQGQAELLTGMMHGHTFPSAMGMAASVPLNDIESVLDVGGGSGCCSIALAYHHPKMTCTVLDLPPVCDAAAAFITEHGLTDRVKTHAADFFRDPWPTGHQAVLFSNVLHDWDTQQCQTLLQRAFEYLPQHGVVLVHEMLLDDAATHLPASAFSLQMAVGTQGAQFTGSQLTDLLNDAGFQRVQLIHTFGHFWTAMATKDGQRTD